ncbi:MAG: Thymidylate synthase ThyX [Candidatus Anoxychlamydiales bacterium]|nr:Thymidylate synthase ThyX [Candidatus Anoxychlamydiales bacterium]NGX40459.1 Thymidylate synthase ThyX [Candidatus Anoxychlamydiales bacterium]
MIKTENFTKEQIDILKKYVTNTSSNIFVLKNLPEVIKGALFSRYSRSSLGLRSLLLKDFILNDEISFSLFDQSSNEKEDQSLAVEKANNFYDRILDGFGDDSIGELGGAHLAIENVSILGAKIIEDCRIGGSPLEKSTRYMYFDKKVNGEYLFYKEPILMTSAYKNIYLETCNHLFDTYSKLIPTLTKIIKKDFPKDEDVSEVAYKAALRAKVLDCLRGLLPASTLTNLGTFGNGRYYENLIRKVSTHSLAEMQEISKDVYSELYKEMPSFVKRADPTSKYQISHTKFIEKTRKNLQILSDEHSKLVEEHRNPGIYLINFDPDSVAKVASSLLFEFNQSSLAAFQKYAKSLSNEEIIRIFEAATAARKNRRHKSFRALENAPFTFEVVADFGIYRDLQRHRMLTQERQLLTCDYGYFIPKEIMGTEMEKDYENAMKKAKQTYDTIANELKEEAQYIVPMAYNLHWYFNINLRSLQWLCELRSGAAGHQNYRYVAQEMAKQVCKKFPEFENFFKFVDFEGYSLGRMDQEIRRVEKTKARR